jgi:hypothetical protein
MLLKLLILIKLINIMSFALNSRILPLRVRDQPLLTKQEFINEITDKNSSNPDLSVINQKITALQTSISPLISLPSTVSGLSTQYINLNSTVNSIGGNLTSLSGSAFVNAGNQFGSTATLGTKDGFPLKIIANNKDTIDLNITGNPNPVGSNPDYVKFNTDVSLPSLMINTVGSGAVILQTSSSNTTYVITFPVTQSSINNQILVNTSGGDLIWQSIPYFYSSNLGSSINLTPATGSTINPTQLISISNILILTDGKYNVTASWNMFFNNSSTTTSYNVGGYVQGYITSSPSTKTTIFASTSSALLSSSSSSSLLSKTCLTCTGTLHNVANGNYTFALYGVTDDTTPTTSNITASPSSIAFPSLINSFFQITVTASGN